MADKKEFMEVKFRVKEADESGDTGYLEGYASVFGNVDHGRDVVHRGAFAKTIKDRNGVFPFLLDHNSYKPAGFSVETEEHEKGLFYKAELKLHDPDVKQRYELAKLSLKHGAPMGNSFGYRAVKYDYEEIETEAGTVMVRNLREVQLFEKSLVMFGMNEAAGVTFAKSAELNRLFALVQKGRYSLNQIEEALAHLDATAAKGQAANNEIDPALHQSMEALRSLYKTG